MSEKIPIEEIVARVKADIDYIVAEAYERGRADEKKAITSSEIRAGDEVVAYPDMNTYLVTNATGKYLMGADIDNYGRILDRKDVRKTGRHFDVQKVKEMMQK